MRILLEKITWRVDFRIGKNRRFLVFIADPKKYGYRSWNSL